MQKRSAIGIVGATLATVFGIGELACNVTGVVDAPPGPVDSGTTGDAGVLIGHGQGEAGAAPDGGTAGSTFIACDSPSPVVIAGKDTGFVRCNGDVNHRAKATACPNTLPRQVEGVCASGTPIDAGGACAHDSDCTAKPYGTCGYSGGRVPSCACSYGCVADTDCAQGEICECGDPVGRCVASNCTDDSSCATGALCASAPTRWGGCSFDALPKGYFCQTTNDTCLTDKSCGSTLPMCAYDADAGARACHDAVVGCPGRPFLVEGLFRVAPTMARSDWSADGVRPSTHELTEATRTILAGYWMNVAQMEHASIAAFARFALELLALGAPLDLVVGAHQAMADETEHARLAFALASAYADGEIGPAPLAIDGALGSVSVRSTFSTLVREGCIGETLAAVEATEALALAVDPAARAALARIARDETKHAELAWRVAKWLLESGDDALRAWARSELDRAIAERAAVRSARSRAHVEPLLASHGVIDEDARAALDSDALRDLVTPCARALFAHGAEQKSPPCAPAAGIVGAALSASIERMN
jgi:hypothetical protein